MFGLWLRNTTQQILEFLKSKIYNPEHKGSFLMGSNEAVENIGAKISAVLQILAPVWMKTVKKQTWRAPYPQLEEGVISLSFSHRLIFYTVNKHYANMAW